MWSFTVLAFEIFFTKNKYINLGINYMPCTYKLCTMVIIVWFVIALFYQKQKNVYTEITIYSSLYLLIRHTRHNVNDV